MTPVQEMIVRAAAEQGIDPNVALAIAERESRFDPHAHASKTIYGMFQMRGDNRAKYGVGDTDDPYQQSSGWGRYFNAVKGEMRGVLGRDPTDTEAYLGHHFGGVRAARMMGMDPNTPVSMVFTPSERAQNPHFDKAGTVGALNSSVMADIDQRRGRYAASSLDLSQFGEPVQAGEPMLGARATATSADGGAPIASRFAPDLSSFGEPVEQPATSSGGSGVDLSKFGTPV